MARDCADITRYEHPALVGRKLQDLRIRSHLFADGISRLRADLVTVGIDPGRAPFERRSGAHGVAVFFLTT